MIDHDARRDASGTYKLVFISCDKLKSVDASKLPPPEKDEDKGKAAGQQEAGAPAFWGKGATCSGNVGARAAFIYT